MRSGNRLDPEGLTIKTASPLSTSEEGVQFRLEKDGKSDNLIALSSANRRKRAQGLALEKIARKGKKAE